MIAVMGTGAWGTIHRVIANPTRATLRTSLEKLISQKVPHLWLSLHAERVGSDVTRIWVNGRRLAVSADGQICVVVIEPNEGVVADAATFAGGEAKTLWSMKQLLPRDISQQRPSR